MLHHNELKNNTPTSGTPHAVIHQVREAVVGKSDIIEQIMMAILAKGHVLVEDIPGTGKTTMALAFSHAMGLKANRVQFTPDVLPADLTGFTIYQKETGKFVYQAGAVMCNLLLADEINRTSPKTQSALLEVMEERQVTVDGVTRNVGNPFVVIATENPTGSAGTQLLPESQLDRFMICVKMGYPTVEEEIDILKRNQYGRADTLVERVFSAKELLAAQEMVSQIYIDDVIYDYIARLAKATREQEMLAMGLSPRGTIALAAMAKAKAFLSGRRYVIPDDVKYVFPAVAMHRVKLSTKAKVGHIQTDDLLWQILSRTAAPTIARR
ncbi:MAG: MoxR family ATPase [Coprococcus sp.]|nr:MoxR family ATPase [Coprococcus sp.]